MKKHIVFSLICTIFFMLLTAPFYLTPTVRVSFHALSDTRPSLSELYAERK